MVSTRRFQLSALRSYHQVPTTAELDIIVDRLVPFTQERLIENLKTIVMTCRAVSEVRKGLCEGDSGFDLVLANKKQQVAMIVMMMVVSVINNGVMEGDDETAGSGPGEGQAGGKVA